VDQKLDIKGLIMGADTVLSKSDMAVCLSLGPNGHCEAGADQLHLTSRREQLALHKLLR
jgi:hypothetical protein